MKCFTLSALVLIFFTSLSAQNKTKLILKVGPNFANQDIEQLYGIKSSITSLNASAILEWPLGKRFNLQSGISLQGKGTNVNIGSLQDVSDKGKVSLTYLELPIDALIKLPLKKFGMIFFGAGPYFALGLHGNEDFGNGVKREKIFQDQNGSYGYRKSDFGINALSGLEMGRHISVNIQYSLGLYNIAPEPYLAASTFPFGMAPSRDNVKNRVFSISAGYIF